MSPPSAVSPTVSLNGNGPVHLKTAFLGLTVGSIGVVYGDIGTSPLYALREAVSASIEPGGTVNRAAVFGVLSLILWALIVTVTLKYVIVLLRADNNGEGGTLALMALAQRALRRGANAIALCGIVSAALFYGDAMITPALSVLSAIEGLKIATPAFDPYIVSLTMAILIVLFAVQSRGTAQVAAFFGPIMLLWFAVIAVAGIAHVATKPEILLAFNPYYAVVFLWSHGKIGLVTLGAVFLAVTGAEALYADLGHFGRKPIQAAWLVLVLPSLVPNYLGQGVLVLRRSQGAGEPVLSAVSGLGAAADGGARGGRDRDRQPGRDHRRLFDGPAGDPVRPAAPHGNPPHLRGGAATARSMRRGSTPCCCSGC